MKDTFEQLLKERKGTYAMTAEQLWHGTVGEHVEQVLANGESLTLESLRGALSKTIANSNADDLIRMCAEKALEKLDAITTKAP